MKPLPRKRSKPSRPAPAEERPVKWQRAEHSKLLYGLRRLARTDDGRGDIDYSALETYVRTRSVSEIQAKVAALKNKVILCASHQFRERRRQERKAKKPIELWTDMASSVTGTLEATINTAFAQMLIVSSTEPCTLKNCDPPQLHTQNINPSRPADRTVPPRPMFRSTPVPGVRPLTPPLLVTKTLAPTMSPPCRLPAPSQVFQVPNTDIPLPQTAAPVPTQPASQTPVTPAKILMTRPVTPGLDFPARGTTTQKPSEQLPLFSSPPPLSSPYPASSPSSLSLTPAPPTQPTPPRLSSPRIQDHPRLLGVNCVVDFERIYRYLSAVLKPEEECHLTAMEGAIMLDLLMSLPEELLLLDCNKLQKHLQKVYKTLLSRSHTRMAKDFFKHLEERFRAQNQSPPAPEADRPADTHSGGVELPPQNADSQSAASNTAANQNKGVVGVCSPLNPFLVPVKLLKRKEVQIM